ncbi:MAG: hypothetical protein K5829_08710 [Treponema sp.]|nr:hypothetical protein [Treponema sp.]
MKKTLLCFFFSFLIFLGFCEPIDDSKYNDAATIEFGLHDKKGNYYCVYHNVNNIKDFNPKDCEVVAQWNHAKWVRKENGDFSITWNDTNGAILILKTTSPDYMTKRGIKVGDSITKINEVYKECAPWQLNFNCKVIVGFRKANMLEEEMMTMAFWTEKGIITSIEIVVGENESWIDRN